MTSRFNLTPSSIPKIKTTPPPPVAKKNPTHQGRSQERSKPAVTSTQSNLQPSPPSSSQSSSTASGFLSRRDQKRQEWQAANIKASREKSQSRSREATPSPKPQTPVKTYLKPIAPYFQQGKVPIQGCYQQGTVKGKASLKPTAEAFQPRQIVQTTPSKSQAQKAKSQQKSHKVITLPPPKHLFAKRTIQKSRLEPRAWTSVNEIGHGAAWGTANGDTYGGLTYTEPRPITEEGMQNNYVVEKGYGEVVWKKEIR